MTTNKLLTNYLTEQGYTWKTAQELIKTAHYKLIKNYIPDCPGWTGNAIMIVWSGDISFYEVLIVKGKDVNQYLERVPCEFK